jgi:transcriptional regulator with GAF, ATPase, and Fis domain
MSGSREQDTEVQKRGPLSRIAFRNAPEVTWKDGSDTHHVTLSERLVIGSRPGLDIVLTDPHVSRLHAELELRNGDAVWIRDLGSTNGTFVGDVRVESALVPVGGFVRVGDTHITVAAAAVPTAIDLWSDDHFGPLVGSSQAMRELFARLARVAASDATVLLQGETGTGKELVAEALHRASPRADRPFVVVDCAGLPENLLESELFGHIKGAFTGAVATRAGAFEVADGGTLVLDEIGELPLAMQPKLLRALEARAIRRLGETKHRKVDVRIVSATHRDLRTMVNVGTFREDLYFRLAVVPVYVPPLRARREDVGMLVERFIGQRPSPFSAGDVADMASQPWPGNVRELRNAVERAIVVGAREVMAAIAPPSSSPSLVGAATGTPEAFPVVSIARPFREIRQEWTDHLEREYVRQLLVLHQGNVAAVAHAADLDRAYVYRLIKKHELGQ